MAAVDQKMGLASDWVVRLGQQCPDGFWYENLSDPKKSWISDAFWQSLGYSATYSTSGSITDVWLSMVSPDQLGKIKLKLLAFHQ